MAATTLAPAALDERQLRAFLSFLVDPAIGATEFRVFKSDFDRGRMIVKADRYSKTIAGWYDDVNFLVFDAKTLRGVSGYVTVNPVHPDLLARSYNKTIVTKNATNDKQVICYRWLYIDIDPRRISDVKDISSSETELAEAIARRDRVLADHPALKGSALWGCSGNGAWILVRLPDYPADASHEEIVAQTLKSLAARYGDELAEIDVKTKNPSRVMCLPGTVKAKGANRPDRPWRLVTFDSWLSGETPEGTLLPAFDLKGWLVENPAPAQPATAAHNLRGSADQASNGSASSDDVDERSLRIWRASKYAGEILGAISHRGGHDKTFDVACNIIKGFDLTITEARPILQWFNSRCIPPWEPHELEHKLTDADALADDKTRGYLFAAHLRGEKLPLPTNLGSDFDFDQEPGETPVEDAFEEVDEVEEAETGNRSDDIPPTDNGVTFNGHLPRPEATVDEKAKEPAAGPDPNPDPDPDQVPERDCVPGSEDNPHRLARLFLRDRYQHAEGYSLRFWREEFHAWDKAAYRTLPRKEIAAEVTGTVEKEFVRLYQAALIRHAMSSRPAVEGAASESNKGKSKEKKAATPKPIPVTTRLVGDVIQAISDVSLLRVRECSNQPSWLGPTSSPDWAAHEILPTQNALVHLPSFVEGKPATVQPTPRFFAAYALNYHFDSQAQAPEAWFRFLGQLWPDDPESIGTLQEWMGHLLTPDTSQQKIMLLVGPKRSGKGTIARILRDLIGPENVVNPTLSSLATHFGLSPLLGKLAAVITDARISGRTDTAVVIERLLSISGEDGQTIDRKHRESITVKLPVRFMLVSNELPKMKDASGALMGRMIFLQLTESFYGREDTTLYGRLARELPGILQWAIAGWARLRERGRFMQPSKAAELLGTMEQLSSPVKVFLDECCRLGDGDDFVIAKGDLYNAWRTWCQAKGQEHSGSDVDFGRFLMATVPTLRTVRPRVEKRPVWSYAGVRLLKEWENNEENKEYVVSEDGSNREPGDSG